MDDSFYYRGWYCSFSPLSGEFSVFPPSQMELLLFSRCPEACFLTSSKCVEFIDAVFDFIL